MTTDRAIEQAEAVFQDLRRGTRFIYVPEKEVLEVLLGLAEAREALKERDSLKRRIENAAPDNKHTD